MNGQGAIATVLPTPQEFAQERSILRIAMTPTMGKGVFAVHDIPKNTKVAVYPGYIYPPQKTNVLNEIHSRYAWEMNMAVGNPGEQSIVNGYSVNAGGVKGTVLPQFEQCAAPFVNEPNTPAENNLYPVINFKRSKGQALEYWSLKNIRAGQQLFICYQRSERRSNGTMIKRCTRGPSVRYIWGNTQNPSTRPGPSERYLTAGKKRRMPVSRANSVQKRLKTQSVKETENNAAKREVAMKKWKTVRAHVDRLIAQQRVREAIRATRGRAELKAQENMRRMEASIAAKPPVLKRYHTAEGSFDMTGGSTEDMINSSALLPGQYTKELITLGSKLGQFISTKGGTRNASIKVVYMPPTTIVSVSSQKYTLTVGLEEMRHLVVGGPTLPSYALTYVSVADAKNSLNFVSMDLRSINIATENLVMLTYFFRVFPWQFDDFVFNDRLTEYIVAANRAQMIGFSSSP